MLDKSYYHKNFILLDVLIPALYDLPDCACGGMCHAITDDDNVRDSDLSNTLGECYANNPFWKDNIEKPLAALICKLFLEMEYKQRVCFICFKNYGLSNVFDTDDCITELGYLIEPMVDEHLENYENC